MCGGFKDIRTSKHAKKNRGDVGLDPLIAEAELKMIYLNPNFSRSFTSIHLVLAAQIMGLFWAFLEIRKGMGRTNLTRD